MLKSKKQEIIQEYKIHPEDKGSSEVQCALLTAYIARLSEHLKVHKHDHSSRRGLIMMVSKRRKLLKYIFSNSKEKYKNLITKLGIRDSIKKA